MKGNKIKHENSDPKGETKRMPSRDLREPAVLAGLSTPRAFVDFSLPQLTVVCAEPGMGKTFLANRLTNNATRSGKPFYRYEYQDIESELASRRVERACRNIIRRIHQTGEKPLVVFDGVPGGDESDTYREAQYIQRLALAGAHVLICLRPEARQLAEALRGAVVLDGIELLYHAYDEDDEAIACTGGIPMLVNAAQIDVNRGTAHASEGTAYLEALSRLIADTLRPTMPDEELRARLAMMILGTGTLEELQMVAGRCDVEMLQWLERDVPLLGSDAHARRFSCFGIADTNVFERCLSTLQPFCADEAGLVVRCCGLLATRGDARRSAVGSALCASEHDYISVCLTWGVTYAAIGRTKTVRDALRLASRQGVSPGSRGLLSAAAVSALSGTAKQMESDLRELEGLQVDSSSEQRLYRQVMLLKGARDVLRAPSSLMPGPTTGVDDVLGIACIEHAKAVRMMASGRFGEAYALLAEQLAILEPRSVPEAQLCDDGMLALALMGGAPDARERGAASASHELFMGQECAKLRSYHLALQDAEEVLMSSAVTTTALEEAISQAERAGDTFVHAFFLAVCAVADVRAHALSRAHVRATRAANEARMLGEGYLTAAAELVDALCLSQLGENDALDEFCRDSGRPSGLVVVGKACARAVVQERGFDRSFEIPVGVPCPPDIFWLLNLLSCGCEPLWASVSGLIPNTWVQSLDAIKRRRTASTAPGMNRRSLEPRAELSVVRGGMEAGKSASAALSAGRQGELLPIEGTGGRIRVKVLGQFAVECDGATLPESALERRRARDLVGLLALVPGHRIRRYQAIDVLWPSDDYYRGPRRLYEATGEARARLSERCQGANALVSDKAQGVMGFDNALVSCDIDDFEREVRMVLSEDGDDFWVLEHAWAMERLYDNGPDESLQLTGHLIEGRIAEIKALYVDGVVAAGEAALRVGKAKLAVRYGLEAHRRGRLREDAMILLVRALRAAGRGHEVPDYYGSFVQTMIEEKGMPPSRALQHVVEMPARQGGRQLSA